MSKSIELSLLNLIKPNDKIFTKLKSDKIQREIPFDSSNKYSATEIKNDMQTYTYVMGAPELLLKKCTKYMDENGNIKVVKPQSNKTSKRIDGVITSIMANNRLDIALAYEIRDSNFSIDDAIV